jgi:hypothetical protein
MTLLTFLMLRFCGSPRCMRGICGGAPERGRPYGSGVSQGRGAGGRDAHQRVLVLETPQRRKQAWLQHVAAGEGAGQTRATLLAGGGGDAQSAAGRRRRSWDAGTFLWGAKVPSSPWPVGAARVTTQPRRPP